jgi:hypothetical protein
MAQEIVTADDLEQRLRFRDGDHWCEANQRNQQIIRERRVSGEEGWIFTTDRRLLSQ